MCLASLVIHGMSLFDLLNLLMGTHLLMEFNIWILNKSQFWSTVLLDGVSVKNDSS